jgi:hypothetical protein
MSNMHKTARLLTMAAGVPVVLVAPWYATVAGAALAGSIYAASARRRAAFYRVAARLAARVRMMLAAMAEGRTTSASEPKESGVRTSPLVPESSDDTLFDSTSRAEIFRFWINLHS